MLVVVMMLMLEVRKVRQGLRLATLQKLSRNLRHVTVMLALRGALRALGA
ncbi:MAG: hypothetical protein QF565_06790 [Arenicellales bacterium]|jgi:hypothetical protein|nr:hypothetical protein [Arenicellales bacterium]